MKIHGYTITNFKGIGYYNAISPGKRTIFVGPNGSGKTSMLEAIRYAITGDCPSNPIRTGAPYAAVEILLDKLAPIQRIQNVGKANQIRYNGTLTTQKSVHEQIQNTFGINMETLKSITSGEILQAMSAGELSKFLTESGLLPLSVDAEQIITECSLSPEAASMIKLFLPSMPNKFGLDEINACYDDFCDQRKLMTRDLKAETAKAEAYTGPIPTRTVADIDKILSSMSNTSADLVIYQNAKKVYDDTKMRRDRQLAEIKTLEEKLAKTSCKAPNEGMKKNAELQIQRLSMQEASVTGTITVLEKNLKMLEKMLSDLQSPRCPLSDKLVCTTDKTAIKDELAQTIADTNAELEKNKKQIADIEAKIRNFKDQISDYERDLSAYQTYVSSSERLKALRAALIQLPSAPVEPKVKPVDTNAINALNKERSDIVAYNLAKEAKKKAAEITSKLAIVSEIVKALDPKGGIRESVIAHALTPLVDYCNTRSKQMKLDIEIDIKASSGSRIYCKTPSSRGFVPLESASSGQKAIIMFLVMDMLNSLSGLGVLFLDGLEVLDEEAFDALLTILETPESEQTYDHVFLCAVNHDDAVKVIAKHAAKMAVENMTVTKAPAASAANPAQPTANATTV